MAEPPAAILAHASPGRLRLRLPGLRGDAARLSALALAAAGLPGVAAAQVSAVTGSLLILHRGPLDDLLGEAAAAELFIARPAGAAAGSAPAIPLARLVPAAGATAAAGLAVVQLLRREALPPALTLGWYALALAQRAMRPGAASAMAAPETPGMPG